ncbi:MAG: uridine diphosphate-N-acetylglucosamine-binding protein YvcK [Candidatus Nanopelagicales bacterium]
MSLRRETAAQGSGPRVVALGGGHGLAATLRALRRVTDRLTAVVGVADDGGSSGRLRRELGVLPPGDLRMALAALCGDDAWGRTWSQVVQHRFTGDGELHGHALGNLLIAALWQETGDEVKGLDWVAALLGAHGRVLPLSRVPLEIVADVLGHDQARPTEVTEVRGQVEVATTPGDVLALRIEPAAPPGCEEAVAAVREADAVVLGPGSWFTSVLPHLLVPDVAEAIRATGGRRVLVLNLGAQPGETDGYEPETHLEVWQEHFGDIPLDLVLADERHVADPAGLEAACAPLGASLVLDRVAAMPEPGEVVTTRHDPDLLAAAFGALLGRGRIAPWR